MGIKIDIKFSGRDRPVYQPGEKVEGEVKLENPSEAKPNAITLRFRGKAHNHWYDGGRKVTYDKQEHYIDNTLSVWSPQGGVVGGDVLKAGDHYFPFSFLLPENAPCSFEGGSTGLGCVQAWVRYAVYVTVDIPYHSDKTQKAMLTVLPKTDLNEDPRARVIPRLEVQEDVGLFNAKPILVRASCNKGGYVPGEIVDITVDIDNKSDNDISQIKVELEQKSAYIGASLGHHNRFVKKSKAASIKDKISILGQSQHKWCGKLPVPSLPPSDLPNCSIIDLQFRLQFKIKYGTFFKNICFKLPFVIGTIPLTSTTSGFQPNPPSYLESVFGPVDALDSRDEELVDGNQYAPLYNYYQWSEQ